MRVRVNAKWLQTQAVTLDELRQELGVGGDAFVFCGGFGASGDRLLEEGMVLTIIEREKCKEFVAKLSKKLAETAAAQKGAQNSQNCELSKPNLILTNEDFGETAAGFGEQHGVLELDAAALQEMMAVRNSPLINSALNATKVGVAGLGGLGSSVAISLARVGVKRLLLVDFDEVDPSNLNRQQYFLADIGKPKTQALSEILARINPFVSVEVAQRRVTLQNAKEVFAGCGIVAECFDNPQSKAALINGLGEECKIVAASGLAGFGHSEEIRQKRLSENVWVCGDLVRGARVGEGLMSPRVGICANFQANLILELLVGMISK